VIEPRDIDCARRLLASAQSSFGVVARSVAVLAHAGAPIPDTAPPLALVLRDLQDGPSALARLPPPELNMIDYCIRPAWAGELADWLHDQKVIPDAKRLIRLLAMSDPARAERFIVDYLQVIGRNGGQWAEHVTEARLGALDAGLPVPSVVEQEFEALVADHAWDNEGSYTARLRLGARQDVRGALPLLAEAAGNVGYDNVEPGLEAVMGRLAGTDREALARHLREIDTLDERITCFRASLWETPEPADVDRLTTLADDLEQDIASHGLFPRERQIATYELMSAAARLGAAEIASRIVLFDQLPEDEIFDATWAPCRKRALAGEAGAISFLEQIAPALERVEQERVERVKSDLSRVGRDVAEAEWRLWLPPPTDWAEWRLWALPLQEQWWRPWDGGLP
jgi:hypothetical protein